jgi:hypothetical protein
MAVQASGVPTLLDLLNTIGPDGKQLAIAEVLTQTNQILDDMSWMEGNTVTGHKDAVRTTLPTPSFRALNEGVPRTKAGSTQIEETCAMLEDFSQVDRELAMLSGDVNGYRTKEAMPHMIGMAHKMAQTVFYGNAGTNPKEFTGLTPRYNSLSTSVSQTANFILNAGGTGSNLRSIWLIGWRPDTVTGLYPKGTVGGLSHEDVTNDPNGKVLYDASGNPYIGFQDHWLWRCGLMVKDYRYVVRIANIDPTALTADAATGPKLIDLMIQALELIESVDGVNAAFYSPRLIHSFLRRQLLNGKNLFLNEVEKLAGKRVMMFGEVPLRRVDALNTAEAQVV